jgi:glycosyltransferase involved in cell wall biosynthesis
VIPSFIAARLFGKRLVYDIYDFYVDSHYVPGPVREFVRRLELWFAEHADGVIIVDRSRLPQLGDARPRRLAVVYNTPEPPAGDAQQLHAPRVPGSLRVAFVGLLSAERGLMQAIEVLRRHPEWHLELAGYGGDVERVAAAARALPNATFHGQVKYDRCLALSGAADVLFATYDPAVPNHRMSSANKLFEAMMLGKPIVVARGTGMDRIVEEHDIGFVVPYGDVDALERAFAEVSAWDDAQRAAVARRCRAAYTEHFSSERMFERTAALYADLDRAPGTAERLPPALAS